MLILDVKASPVSVPLRRPATFATRTVRHRDYTVVEVTTDEGINGTGVVWWHHPALIIQRYLKDLIIGKNPFDIEKIWRSMYRELYRERKGAAICAISAVDMALWDIFGKYLKLPLFRLLGGSNNRVHCYASGGYYKEGKGADDLAQEMRGYVEMGFTAMKMKVGALSIEKDIERVKAAREAIGPNIKLAVDANNAYTPVEAVRAGRMYEKFDVWWFEEPTWPDDLHGSALVASQLDVAIAAGELEYTRYGFKELIEHHAVDIVQPDVTFCGGVSEFMKIVRLTQAWNLPIAPHAWHDLHVHLAAAAPNAITVEYFLKEADIMKETELFEKTVEPRNGFLEPPNLPGLGIQLNPKAVERYRVKS